MVQVIAERQVEPVMPVYVLMPHRQGPNDYTAMSPSATDRSVSQNNSERPSSSRTSTAACSEFPQQFCTVPIIPANWLFQWPSLTRTTVPLRASLACKTSNLLFIYWSGSVPSSEVRGTSKARRFRPRTARLPPGSWDDRRSSLSCRRGLFRFVYFRPALPPTCLYAPRAIPRSLSPLAVYRLRPGPGHQRRHGVRSHPLSLSSSIYVAGFYTFVCTLWHSVSSGTRKNKHGLNSCETPCSWGIAHSGGPLSASARWPERCSAGYRPLQ